MKSYRTPTGAFISEHDYNFLSTSQQEKCIELDVKVKKKVDDDFNAIDNAFKLGYSKAIDDAIKKFDAVFEIAPQSDNILEIVKAFKIAFLEIEKLKSNQNP